MGNVLVWEYLLAAVPFMGLYAARKRVFVLPTFFILHGLFILLPFIVFSSWEERIPMGVGAVLCVIYSVRARGKEEWRPDTRAAIQIIFCMMVMFLVTVFLFRVVDEDLERYFFGVTFMMISAMLLVIHMANVDMRMEILATRLKDMTSARSVLAANNVIISGFLAFVMAVGMFSLFSPVVWRWMVLGAAALVSGAMLLFSLPMVFGLWGGVETEVGEEIIREYPIPFELNLENPEIFDLLLADGKHMGYASEEGMEFALHFFYWQAAILFLLLAIVLFFAARSILRKLIKNFYNAADGDENESLLPDDTKSRFKFMLGDAVSAFPRWLANIKNPVRRAYIKKVAFHIKKGVRVTHSDTPAGIADKIRPREDIDELTGRYERVRYGKG
jgi:hypothetical protein